MATRLRFDPGQARSKRTGRFVHPAAAYARGGSLAWSGPHHSRDGDRVTNL